MRTEQYFRSLAIEMGALRDRVRFLIEDRHWQTDGEWKESVIRQVLRRHLPASVSVGRGFVVARNRVSHQIDILIYDSSKPRLFQDGDLAFVTPDAVLGVVEVKSRAPPTIIDAAAKKLATDMEIVHTPMNNAFAAIFAFEDGGGSTSAYLDALAQSADRWTNHVDFMCIGESRFMYYWHLDPTHGQASYHGWHSYSLEQTAPGFFIHNIIDKVSPQSVFSNKDIWFPVDGKEAHRDGQVFAKWRVELPQV